MAGQHIIGRPEAPQKEQQARKHGLKDRAKPLIRFWQKLSNDWVFNLSGLLAYNLLMSIFPILLALLAIAGFVFNTISPGSEEALVRAIANALPGGYTGTGGKLVHGALHNLQRQAGGLLIIGLITSIFTGSRLFITIENCFGVIFRLRGRDAIHQNLMAVGMLALYIVLIPILFLASIAPTAILNSLKVSQGGAVNGLLVHVVGLVVAFVVALLFFSALYIVVPNRPVRFSEVWRGTLAAACLLVLYEALFPIYESVALRPNSYGSAAAFAIVILVFFYYFALILLVGAEMNSWGSGQRETASDIAAILHEVQAHNTTRGAAGPTAGERQEDLQHSKGARTMATPERAGRHEHNDHHVNVAEGSLRRGTSASAIAPATQASAPHDETRNSTHAVPYTHEVMPAQPHTTAPLATRRLRTSASPNASVRQRRTERVASVVVLAGVAALAYWLQRRGG
jgi:membrane protein